MYRVRNVTVRNCSFRNCSAIGTVFRGVDVDGFKKVGRQPLILWGSLFCNVRLAGRIGFFKLALAPNAARASAAYTQRWGKSCTDFYAGVDWALDITAAKFTFGPDLHFVPGHLVRRDPSTQILVTKDQARSALGSDLALGESSVATALTWFLDDSPYDSTVIAAPLGSRLFERDLAAFETLRSRGCAT